ncbi:MAG TPA: hypothetical protein VGR62_03325 [Candidatus Binatia bacterium]|jgi:hypothetical protein|nr:hypothetical protein [Candidatus Binatia bacterium]
MTTMDAARPERQLLSAVLEDAMRVLYFSRRASHRREVWEWMSDDFAEDPFAFVALCETLDLDPGAVRAMARHNMVQRGRPLPSVLDRAA